MRAPLACSVALLAVLAGASVAGIGSQVNAVPAAALETPASDHVVLEPLPGGPGYFAKFSADSAWMDSHIMLGGWEEQPQNATEVGYAVAMGSNTYFNLAGTPGSDVADFNVIRAGGMHVIAPESDANTGSETVAHFGLDEPDLRYGPAAGTWNAANYNGCATSTNCGYTAAHFYYDGDTSGVSGIGRTPYPNNGLPVWDELGKGVLIWETQAQAEQFFHYTDIAEADDYWLTDQSSVGGTTPACFVLPLTSPACDNWSGPGLSAAQAHQPANYYWDVEKLESLATAAGRPMPTLGNPETGCPWTNQSPILCATPPESVAAAWQSLIAGARGINWFQHSFSGPCVDSRTFIDGSNPSSSKYSCQQTPGVTLHDVVVAVSAFNHEVQDLNNVLLSPTATGYETNTGVDDTMVKAYGGSCYVFAASGEPFDPPPSPQTVSFSLADGYTGPVSVYDESRTVQATDGVFHDTFADQNSVHIYVIPGSNC